MASPMVQRMETVEGVHTGVGKTKTAQLPLHREKDVAVPFNAIRVTEKNGKRYLVVDTTSRKHWRVHPVIPTTVRRACGNRLPRAKVP
jgi:hypothetical protein